MTLLLTWQGLCENEAKNESQEMKRRTCNICGAQFDEKKELRAHKRAVHMFCAICNARLGTSAKAYKKHMRKRHPFFLLRPSPPPPKTSPHYPATAKGAPRKSAPPTTFSLSNVDHARSESTDWSDGEDSISDSEESEIEQAGPASPDPQAVTNAELSTGLIEQPSHLDILTLLRSASEPNSPVVDDQYGGPLASAGAFGEAATLAGSAVDDVDTPRTYDIFRCPVCDKSYYTLEVLSDHMLDNGHGRFGSVHTAGTRHKRIESAPASTAAFNISAAGMTPDTPVVPDRTRRATAGGGSTAPAAPAYMTSVTAHQAVALTAPSKATMDEHAAYNLSFSTEGEINAHYSTPDVYPSCGVCGASFQDMNYLSQHCEAVHGASTSTSRMAGRFAAESQLEASPDRAECSKCGAVFEGDAELLEHKRSSHTFEYCARCDRWYSARHLLLRHFYESPGQHPRCTECRLGFAGDEEPWSAPSDTS
ncbi:hypothetical protein DAEQUDRAFT_333744 [Daedalea quercina L-15889]|uniref:C2H2-type domain-containing protein n=1 Tax=Daedalea quercina L-15889 TaxID=1314783 RepID=A0A165PMU4_9APHY|nr:hypothetical protein DAEQUDRAFT_333744 [Daedalea quercina L-15889]